MFSGTLTCPGAGGAFQPSLPVPAIGGPGVGRSLVASLVGGGPRQRNDPAPAGSLWVLRGRFFPKCYSTEITTLTFSGGSFPRASRSM